MHKIKDKITVGALDGLTGDIVIKLEDSKNAREFLERLEIIEKIANGGSDKITLSDEEYRLFSQLVPDAVKDPYPGGSAYNTLCALSQLIPNMLIRLISTVGIRKNGLAIRDSAIAKNIAILPEMLTNEAITINTPVSYVLIDKHGKKIILKHPGNIGEFIKKNPDYIKRVEEDLVDSIASSDMFMLPGGATRKYNTHTFKLGLNHITHNDVSLIFTLPTHSDITKPEAELYLKALSAAKIIMGNADELKTTINAINHHLGHGKPIIGDELLVTTTEESMKSLQSFAERKYRANKSKFPIAFITDGKEDAYVIMQAHGHSIKAEIKEIKTLPDPPVIATNLGAGDASFAGFLGALLKKYNPITAAEIAMHFGLAALKIIPAQLSKPLEVFADALQALDHPKKDPDAPELLKSARGRFA